MEAQLAEYRARKAKERQELKNKEQHFLFRRAQPSNVSATMVTQSGKQHQDDSTEEEKSPLSVTTPGPNAAGDTVETYNIQPKVPSWLVGTQLGDILCSPKVLLNAGTLLKVVLWLILWFLFIELEFGAVYFVISLLVIMYTSMKSGSRKPGEASAYSVFNPNCERLDGTFTMEQFERELRFGAGSVR